jgi:hypothetical protein
VLEVVDQLSLRVLHEDVPASSWTPFPKGSQGPARELQSRPTFRPGPGGTDPLAVDRGHPSP